MIAITLAGFGAINGQQVDGTARPSTFWLPRYHALENLKKQTKGQLSEAQKGQLIAQLQDENRFIHEFNSKNHGEKSLDTEYGEGYGEYYSDLLDIVVKFADWNRPTVLRTLIFSTYDSDSSFGKRLAAQGENAFTAVQDLSKSEDPFARANAAGLLGHMASDNSLPCERSTHITNLLTSLSSDREEVVRYHAVRGLAALRTPHAVKILQQLSASDAVSVRNEDGTVSYPVREIAQRKLQEISDSGGARPDPCPSPSQSK